MPISSDKPAVIVICGPTASGKTGLVCKLARQFELEVVSADSRQVYRQMDIGTAKPTLEEQEQVPHHLIDIVNPDEPFSVADFVQAGRQVIEHDDLFAAQEAAASGNGTSRPGRVAGMGRT